MTCTIDVHLVLESEMSLSKFTNSVNKSSENVKLEIVEICHLKKIVGPKFFTPIIRVDRGRNSASYSLSHLEDISKDHFLKTEEWEVSDTSSSLDLLLQVQRLLVSRIFPLDGEGQVPTMGTEKGGQWKISIIYSISIHVCLHDLACLILLEL